MKHLADIFPLSYFWFQVICVKTSQLADFMPIYVSINSKPDVSAGRPPGIRMFNCPGGRGFELEKIFFSFKRKMQELLELFQRNWRQLENSKNRCLCAVLH